MTRSEHLLGVQPSAHWTVANNYRLRAASFAIMFLSVLFHGWDKGYSPILWGLIAAQLLIYPHIVFLLARRSSNAQHAESNNLMVDCLMFGALAAALQFPLWIAFTVYTASTLNITISAGLRGLLRSQLAFFSGILVVGLSVGWHLSPGTEWPATIMCLIGNAVYMVAIGLTAFGRNRQLRQTREALRKGENTLKQQLAEIQTLQEKLQEQAVRDPLTGLYNRRFLDTIVARELARCEREGLHLTVMMIDVDHFKKVNDTYGHPGGDEVLKKLATLLLEKVRVIDVACRFGGEEFLLMLPSMSPEFAIVRAEQCREAFAQATVEFDGQTIRATMSVGIAVYPQHGDTLSELTRCADVALYQAKEAGRNRVVLYTS
jgi:diguanylate cyclase